MPIAVLSEYTEKEYEPFDPYSRFYPAMPISVCFSDTALYTLGNYVPAFFVYLCHTCLIVHIAEILEKISFFSILKDDVLVCHIHYLM